MGARALGELGPHNCRTDRFASCKRSPKGRTVGVMLRLTPIEDPKTWKEEAGKTPPDAPDAPSAPQGEEKMI